LEKEVDNNFSPVLPRILALTFVSAVLLVLVGFFAIAVGSSGSNLAELLDILVRPANQESAAAVIILQIRLPRVILAAAVGATLALGGLVFQALLRNPLAEPYILGISGGSAVGAILGMLSGLSLFPGVSSLAFAGSMATLGLVLALTGPGTSVKKDSLLLGGVMMNAFCSAVIMFLISLSQAGQVHHILFWLMGDLSMVSNERLFILMTILPCFLVIFILARPMNLMLAGRDAAAAMGVNVRAVTVILLLATSFMVSVVVCQSGLIGFIGLVIPHIFRQVFGPDHRLLVPACILGGGSYLVLCDLLARTLPSQGEMPVGIVTALIGAPLFIFLLVKSR